MEQHQETKGPDLIRSLRRAALRHGYLLIAAAWLYTISFISTNYWAYSASPEKVRTTLQNYLTSRESRLESFFRDTALLNDLVSGSPSRNSQQLIGDDIGVFAYAPGKTDFQHVFWNTNSMSVSQSELFRADGNYAVVHRNGYFELVRRAYIKGGRVYVFAGMVPVFWKYAVNNDYLKNTFAYYPDIANLYEISRHPDELVLRNGKGEPLFYLNRKASASFDQPGILAISLRVLSILLLAAFINMLASELVADTGFTAGYLFLTSLIIFVRALTWFLPFPFNFHRLGLFDPAVFHFGALFPSLGDMLINCVIFYWLTVFFRAKYQPSEKRPARQMRIAAVSGIAGLMVTGVGIATLIGSLERNSNVSFDVTDFQQLSGYTVVALACVAFLLLVFFYLSRLLITYASNAGLRLEAQMLTGTITGLALLSFWRPLPGAAANFCCLLWLLAYLFVTIKSIRPGEERQKPGDIVTSPFLLVWVLVLSLSATAVLMRELRARETEVKRTLAEQLARRTDPSAENMLHVSLLGLTDSFMINNGLRFLTPGPRHPVKDSLLELLSGGYLSRYEPQVHIYDSTGHEINGDEPSSYHLVDRAIAAQARPTGSDSLFYYETPRDLFGFIFRREINLPGGRSGGHLVITLRPRRYAAGSLPSLFEEDAGRKFNPGNANAYAIYNRGRLLNSYNDFPFKTELATAEIPGPDFTVREGDGYSQVWLKSGSSKLIVVASRNKWITQLVTLFAYVLAVLLGLILLLRLLVLLLGSRFNWKKLRRSLRFNIKDQIQATILFIIGFSFLVIGIATISIFISRFNRNNRDRLTKAIEAVSTTLGSTDSLHSATVGSARRLAALAEIYNTDLNVYDARGDVMFSTQPYVFSSQVLSKKMDPQAWYQLTANALHSYSHSEKIAGFSFLSLYMPARDSSGRITSFVNIPYLSSRQELNEEISDFLVVLIDLNALIFLVAGAISFLITNRITRSFSLIGSRMQELSLGGRNEEIPWDKNDEIGTLVGEYNRMVRQLGESARALAKSEREGAWREMARQVAHEIKNPLTPMKLGVQYLQQAIARKAANVEELTLQLSATLVTQIDQLSKIAGDFSQFANISQASPELFDIAEVITTIEDLYDFEAVPRVRYERYGAPCMIHADRTQMTRLFTNLVKNGIEAAEGNGGTALVVISLLRDENSITAIVSDNGPGIPLAVRDRIFTPNFTTKSSGTGLGLAMCKGIVEKANGEIWFETSESGTKFFVRLPVDGSGF